MPHSYRYEYPHQRMYRRKDPNCPRAAIFLQGRCIGNVPSATSDRALDLINRTAHQLRLFLSYEIITLRDGFRILLNPSQEESACKRVLNLDRVIAKGGYCSGHQPPHRREENCTECAAARREYNQALQKYPQQDALLTKRLSKFIIYFQHRAGIAPASCHLLGPICADIGKWFRQLFDTELLLTPRHIRPGRALQPKPVPDHVARKAGMGLPRHCLFLQGRYLQLYSDGGERGIVAGLEVIQSTGGRVLAHTVIPRQEGDKPNKEFERLVADSGGERSWMSRERISEREFVFVNLTCEELEKMKWDLVQYRQKLDDKRSCDEHAAGTGSPSSCSECRDKVEKHKLKVLQEEQLLRQEYEDLFESVRGQLQMQFAQEVL